MKKLSDKYIIAFLSSIIIGIIAHGYVFMNIILYGDNILFVKGDYCKISGGRWFGSVLETIFSKLFSSITYNPIINGLTTIIIMSVVSMLLVHIFNIKKKSNIILFTGCLITFTSLTSLFSYMYTSHIYAISILLATLSLYFMTVKLKYNLNIVISIICGVLSMAIYQLYIGFMILGYFIYLGYNFYKNGSNKELIINGLKYILVSFLILIIYIYSNKLALHISHEQISIWKNIYTISSIYTVFNIKNGISEIYNAFFNPDILNVYVVNLKYIYYFILVIILLLCLHNILKLFHQKKYCSIILNVLMVLLLPISFNFMLLSYMEQINYCTYGYYHQVLILIIPILLLENINIKWIKNIVSCIIIYFIIYCIVIATTSYVSINMIQTRKINWVNNLVTRIESLDEFNANCKYAIITQNDEKIYRDVIFNSLFSFDNKYNLTNMEEFSIVVNEDFIKMWTGFNLEYESEKNINLIRKTFQFNLMPYYPDEDSIEYFSEYNTIVIKMAN